MKPNVGPMERYARLTIGIVAAVSAVTLVKSQWAAALLGAVAASGIETGLSRYCPLNELLHVDNAPGEKESPMATMLEWDQSWRTFDSNSAALFS